MIVFTCNEFKKDLSNYNVSSQYKNSWFNGALFSVLTFPIEIEIEGYFEPYRGHIETNLQKVFEGYLNMNGKLSFARWKIMEIRENTLQISIESGLEQFPSWDLKLSDLPLHRESVTDIRTHAESILTKAYPEVNYNFPMVHCDLYPNDNVFGNFQKIYNKRDQNGFVTNSIDVENNEVFNYNIMRPFPYILHVLKSGINLANYSLHGDILNDTILNKTLLIPGKQIEIKDRPETIEWNIGLGDFTFGDDNRTFGVYYSTQQILHFGKFRLKGVINSQGLIRDVAEIKINGSTLFSQKITRNTPVDIIFNTSVNNNDQLTFKIAGDYRIEAANFEITPLELYDETGAQINYLVDTNEIDLRFDVPNATFGELVSYLIAQKNYSFDLVNGNEIHMNLLNPETLPTEAVDLRSFQVKNNGRNLSEITSFELKYTETGNDKYPSESLYYDLNGAQLTNYSVKDDTTIIEINGIPLPIDTASSITTARMISDDENKICVAIYDGLMAGQNTTQAMDYFKIYNILEQNYKRWFEFQLKSISYTFSFRKNVTDIIQFNEKSKVYAYQNYHFISEMNVTRISPGEEEYELKTFTIRP